MAKVKKQSETKSFTVKNEFTLQGKNYLKGDKIELENQDSIDYMKKQHLIN